MRRRIWARAKHGLGWNDPTFAHDFVAKMTCGVVPAHSRGEELCFARVPTRM
jgi:hypothetical protein